MALMSCSSRTERRCMSLVSSTRASHLDVNTSGTSESADKGVSSRPRQAPIASSASDSTRHAARLRRRAPAPAPEGRRSHCRGGRRAAPRPRPGGWQRPTSGSERLGFERAPSRAQLRREPARPATACCAADSLAELVRPDLLPPEVRPGEQRGHQNERNRHAPTGCVAGIGSCERRRTRQE